MDSLSPREQDVLRLIAQGFSQQGNCGARLQISTKTVETYKAQGRGEVEPAHPGRHRQIRCRSRLARDTVTIRRHPDRSPVRLYLTRDRKALTMNTREEEERKDFDHNVKVRLMARQPHSMLQTKPPAPIFWFAIAFSVAAGTFLSSYYVDRRHVAIPGTTLQMEIKAVRSGHNPDALSIFKPIARERRSKSTILDGGHL